MGFESSLTAIDLVLFGISDYIEARTGAWWDPVWLLIMNVACIAGFVFAGWKYRQLRAFYHKTERTGT